MSFPGVTIDHQAVVNARNDLIAGLAPPRDSTPVEWRESERLVAYEAALIVHEGARRRDRGRQPRASSSGSSSIRRSIPPAPAPGRRDLIDARFPVHGTGAAASSPITARASASPTSCSTSRCGPDLRRFVATLEEWIIRTLAVFGVAGERREDRIGVWVRRPEKGADREDKIAAIGIRVSAGSPSTASRSTSTATSPHYRRHSAVRRRRARLRRHQPRRSRRAGRPGRGRCRAATRVPVAVREHRGRARRQSRILITSSAAAKRARRKRARQALPAIRRAAPRRGHPCRRRPAAAGVDIPLYRLGGAGEHRLDRAVAPVADPAFEATLERACLDPGPVADALHAAADDDVADCLRAHPSSPVSRARTPYQREGDHRSSERM